MLLTAVLTGGLATSLAACSNSPTGDKDVQLTGPVQTEGVSPTVTTSTTPESSSSASLTPTGSPSGSPSGSVGIETVTVDVRGGRVEPAPARVEVDPGTQVRLVLTSDADNELHVHGVELERAVTANQPLTVTFIADQAGVYDVELHDPQLLLFKLAVR